MPEHRKSRSDAAQRAGRRELLLLFKRAYEGRTALPPARGYGGGDVPDRRGRYGSEFRRMVPRVADRTPKRKLLARYYTKHVGPPGPSSIGRRFTRT